MTDTDAAEFDAAVQAELRRRAIIRAADRLEAAQRHAYFNPAMADGLDLCEEPTGSYGEHCGLPRAAHLSDSYLNRLGAVRAWPWKKRRA